MIVTDIGAKQLADNDKVTIDKVVFSDFDFNLVTNDQMQAMTGFNDNDNVVVTPDVALLANNHVIVQADAPAVDFRINSVFLFGTGQPTGDVFLLAVDENQSGTFSQELDINAIKKLSFNATSNDIVLRSDLQSMVASAYTSVQSSYASDSDNDASYQLAKSFTISTVNSKADVTMLSDYAKNSDVASLASLVTNTNSGLSTKANTSDVNSLYSAVSSATSQYVDSLAGQINSLSSVINKSTSSSENNS